MSSITRPRGPLPQRVYWVRRALVLGTLVTGVVVVASLVNPNDDNGPSPATALQAAAEISPSASPSAKDRAAGRDRKADQQPDGASTPEPTPTVDPTPTPTPVAPATPSGPCTPEDVVVTPSVPSAVAGSPVAMQLSLATRSSPACTWTVSPETMTLKISAGADDVWYSRECPSAIAPQDVVLRNDQPTLVSAVWSARRSNTRCTDAAKWSGVGTYTLSAASLGGEPASVDFDLTKPVARTVTLPPKPVQSPTAPSTAVTPSGAVEPVPAG